MHIEVDENGTLDLSMKKCKENVQTQARTPPQEPLTPSEAAAAKGGSLLIGPAFYQPLCERDSWESPLNFSKAHVLQDPEVRVGHEHPWPTLSTSDNAAKSSPTLISCSRNVHLCSGSVTRLALITIFEIPRNSL